MTIQLKLKKKSELPEKMYEKLFQVQKKERISIFFHPMLKAKKKFFLWKGQSDLFLHIRKQAILL